VKEKTDEIMMKIGDIMQSEAFFLPISSPLHHLYIDRNLKGIEKIETFQDITTVYNVVRKISIKEEYALNLDNKSFQRFFGWFVGKLQSKE
jgi:hypothetical protein